MKNFCVIHILLFLLLMLAYQCVGAQDYVVTSKGDTVRGEVKPLTYGLDQKVQVTGVDKKKIIFPIVQTKGYFLKGDMYHPVRLEKGYTYMKLLKSGYLNLYAFQLENQLNFDGLYLMRKDGKSMEVPNLTFKKTMVKFLEDCETVSEKIEKGDLGKRQLNQIIDEFNSCIENKSSNHQKNVAQQAEQIKKLTSWDVLEEKVKVQTEFEGKTNALEMITDIKNKIGRSEKIPNFLLDGLKSSLANANVKDELETAIKELN